MKDEAEKYNLPFTAWMLILASVAVAAMALCAGAAHSGVRQARAAAARASAGHIEAVLHQAEYAAREAGLGGPPAGYAGLMKSYDAAGSASLPAYEKFVLDTMLNSFGPARAFDFAVNRYEDSLGAHLQIYYFPARGRTDVKKDRYYLLADGALTENGPG